MGNTKSKTPKALPLFKIILFFLLSLICLFIIILIVFAICSNAMHESDIPIFQERLYVFCKWGLEISLSAIVGLITGNVTSK